MKKILAFEEFNLLNGIAESTKMTAGFPLSRHKKVRTMYLILKAENGCRSDAE